MSDDMKDILKKKFVEIREDKIHNVKQLVNS